MVQTDVAPAGNPALSTVAPAAPAAPAASPSNQYDEAFQASLNDARSSVQAQLRNALDEIGRQQSLGQQQVDTLPGQYGTINDQAVQGVNALGAHADATQAAAGVHSYQPASTALAPILATMAAQQSTRQAGVPLLGMGLQQEAARQSASANQGANAALSSVDSEQRSYLMQQSQQAQAAARAAAQRSPDQILADAFGSTGNFNQYVNAQTPGLQAAQAADYNQNVLDARKLGSQGNLAARADANENSNPGLTSSQVAEQLGQAAGLPAGIGTAVYAPEAARQEADATKQVIADQKAADQTAEFDPVKIAGKTGISAGMVRSVQGADFYKTAEQSVTANVGMYNPDGSPYTREQLAADLNQHFGKYPSTVKILLAEYGSLFPTAQQAAATPAFGG